MNLFEFTTHCKHLLESLSSYNTFFLLLKKRFVPELRARDFKYLKMMAPLRKVLYTSGFLNRDGLVVFLECLGKLPGGHDSLITNHLYFVSEVLRTFYELRKASARGHWCGFFLSILFDKYRVERNGEGWMIFPSIESVHRSDAIQFNTKSQQRSGAEQSRAPPPCPGAAVAGPVDRIMTKTVGGKSESQSRTTPGIH